ncbi:alkaline phosphatase D family protein [Aurantiacibacter gangjinensis]|uniref:Alkaline phosphatase n=1 Tax=Aurantiacibacter gangjinensis TaxID=502682 RepID=A0A0G9MM38_9SPHN|nr:alkaline phosphatase D family protein [Aurantiacibacter gangjinensis]APE27761.1 secreted alkaline phosphatase [Aurantiacibacter gangjinensis]KLE31757.1 alkaline phosphatase [Aurantiacibacter gangjinensis]
MTTRIETARLAMSRRNLLRGFGGAAAALFGLKLSATPLMAQAIFRDYPFQLGVASGEAAADGFVLWTRLAPSPLEYGHGMPAAAVEVRWEVAADEGMREIVQSGTALARPELGHSVHAEVSGLLPGRPYWYRFSAGQERSMRGRAMTAPAPGASVDRVRFAIAGCQNYEHGYYTAHRFLAEEQPDLVFCYGDYIYEGRGRRIWNSADGPRENPRQVTGDELYSIDDYRRRYAEYKMDADLQAAHAAAPWFVTWDDHEIDNNWVSHLDQDEVPPAIFRLRQQMAMQAYYENMPLRASSLPIGPSMRLYRQARYGDLLDLNLLDTRQYRSDQPCGDGWQADCAEIARQDAQVLGAAQADWLDERLRSSEATWQVLAQQVMMMDLDRQPGEGYLVNPDSWGGYRAPRARLLETLRDLRGKNPVVLTGDEHQNFAGELHLDGRDPGAEPIAPEFVTTSITSNGDGVEQREDTIARAAENLQFKWHNAQRGFALCDVTKERWQTDFRVLDKVTERGGTMRSAKVATVETGSARLHLD